MRLDHRDCPNGFAQYPALSLGGLPELRRSSGVSHQVGAKPPGQSRTITARHGFRPRAATADRKITRLHQSGSRRARRCTCTCLRMLGASCRPEPPGRCATLLVETRRVASVGPDARGRLARPRPWWQSEELDVDDRGLLLDGRSVAAVVAEHGTPLYICSAAVIRRRFRELRAALARPVRPFRSATP